MYSLLKPLLFKLDPETAHTLAAKGTAKLTRVPLLGHALGGLLGAAYNFKSERLQVEFAGLRFPNPVGMAAGFDKTGELYSFLAGMGFGFIECGTFTALEQPGNPRPRIFRYPKHEALVNRMGFNNPGADKAAEILSRVKKFPVPRGVNIGKSKVAPIESATDDYLQSLRTLARLGDYVAVNVSSPNTPGLRQLQGKQYLDELLSALKAELRDNFNDRPLLVKVAPDLSDEELEDVTAVCLERGLAGIIISNTTLDRAAVPEAADEAGGLSGVPVRERSTRMIRRAYRATQGRLPIIGVGGIFSGADALEKIKAGARLVQIYTGYIYRGPSLPARINRYLDRYCREQQVELSELVGVDADMA